MTKRIDLRGLPTLVGPRFRQKRAERKNAAVGISTPAFRVGYCVECGAEAHEGCKDPLAVGEWAPKEG